MADKQKDAPEGVFSLTELTDYQPASVVSRTLIDKKVGTVTLFAFSKGQGLSEHTAPYDAFVTILDGSCEITVGGTPHNLCAGQAIIMPADIPHALRATEAFKMMLVMIRSGE